MKAEALKRLDYLFEYTINQTPAMYPFGRKPEDGPATASTVPVTGTVPSQPQMMGGQLALEADSASGTTKPAASGATAPPVPAPAAVPAVAQETVPEAPVTPKVDVAAMVADKMEQMAAALEALGDSFKSVSGSLDRRMDDVEAKAKAASRENGVDIADMASLHSFPYNLKLTDYWADKLAELDAPAPGGVVQGGVVAGGQGISGQGIVQNQVAPAAPAAAPPLRNYSDSEIKDSLRQF